MRQDSGHEQGEIRAYCVSRDWECTQDCESSGAAEQSVDLNALKKEEIKMDAVAAHAKAVGKKLAKDTKANAK